MFETKAKPPVANQENRPFLCFQEILFNLFMESHDAISRKSAARSRFSLSSAGNITAFAREIASVTRRHIMLMVQHTGHVT